MKNKSLYIHIGWPKTATTTLQQTVFPNLNNVAVIHTESSQEAKNIIHSVVNAELPEFNIQKDGLLGALECIVAGKEKVVFSEEAIVTGSSYVGQVGRYEISQRLYQLFPNAKIIAVVRNQTDALWSYYLQTLKSKPFQKLDFSSWLSNQRKQRPGTNALDYFMYAKTLALYESLFGKENIKVLHYESFLREPETFLGDLLSFLEIDQKLELETIKNLNPSLSKGMRLYNIMSRIYVARKVFSLLGPIKPKIKDAIFSFGRYEKQLTSDEKDYISDFYKEDNSILHQRYNISL